MTTPLLTSSLIQDSKMLLSGIEVSITNVKVKQLMAGYDELSSNTVPLQDMLREKLFDRIIDVILNYDDLEMQPADDDHYYFSFLTNKINNKQIKCGMTYTNNDVHKIIRSYC